MYQGMLYLNMSMLKPRTFANIKFRDFIKIAKIAKINRRQKFLGLQYQGLR